jgi:hypothetical protein
VKLKLDFTWSLWWVSCCCCCCWKSFVWDKHQVLRWLSVLHLIMEFSGHFEFEYESFQYNTKPSSICYTPNHCPVLPFWMLEFCSKYLVHKYLVKERRLVFVLILGLKDCQLCHYLLHQLFSFIDHFHNELLMTCGLILYCGRDICLFLYTCCPMCIGALKLPKLQAKLHGERIMVVQGPTKSINKNNQKSRNLL